MKFLLWGTAVIISHSWRQSTLGLLVIKMPHEDRCLEGGREQPVSYIQDGQRGALGTEPTKKGLLCSSVKLPQTRIEWYKRSLVGECWHFLALVYLCEWVGKKTTEQMCWGHWMLIYMGYTTWDQDFARFSFFSFRDLSPSAFRYTYLYF